MDYQWFPGHMAKALRQMKRDLTLVDLVIEIVDARVPYSSVNPLLSQLAKGKPHMIVLNKADLAEESYNRMWKQYYEEQGHPTVLCDSKNKQGIRAVVPAALDACAEKIARNRAKGLQNKAIRAMVVGVPNVGKSTFINTLAGRTTAKTGNRPGVTKGLQWIRLNPQLELLDTPGVMMPKCQEVTQGERLALIGSIKDELFVPEELAFEFLKWLAENESEGLRDRYGISVEDPLVAMEEIGRRHGCLRKGGIVDYERTGRQILDDFRNGRLGRLTIDRERK